MQYEYNSILGGFRWNLIQKISIALNIPINLIGSADTYGDNAKTFITFADGVTLTSEQKTILDNIVANITPCSVPINTGNTTLKIADIWKSRKWLIDQFGVLATIWWDEESEDGSTPCYAYIQFQKYLTLQEKLKVKNIITGVTEV